jgi:hypothetical protein
MKKIIFFVILLFTGEARSEETYLNCKWDYGRVVKENGIVLDKVMKKGEPATNDQLVTINFKNKKIINSPGGLAREVKIDNWSEKYISWHIEHKADKVSFIYRLDRVSGKLEEIYLDEIHKDQIKTFYICDKTQKKF